jgi:hypothetical protein
MKRIYMTAALLGALATGASAQNVDLLTIPVIDSNYHMPPTGKPFTLTGIFDTNIPGGDSITASLLYAIAPGSFLVNGDQVFVLGPFATVSSEGAIGRVFTASEDIIPEDVNLVFAVAPITISDSINTLLNIPNFEADSTFFVDLLVPRQSLVVGQTYGWYGLCRPHPQGAYADSFRDNNFRYIPIIWGGSGTSIADMINKPTLTPLSIYPNPTVDNISFELQFSKANKSTVVRVLDIKGSAISTTSFGNAGVGAKKYSVNVAQLPAGMYSLQVITDNSISVEKFVKK